MNRDVLVRHRDKLLLLLAAVIVTSVLQMWIGRAYLYLKNNDKIAMMHQAILDQQPPDGRTWNELGANGLAQRLPVVLLAEFGRDVTGLAVHHVYWLQDSVFLFAELLLLMVWLRRFLPRPWAVVGWLWFVAIAPTTYLFYYFHPWDRPSQCLWLLALIGMVDRRHWQFFVALAVGMAVKMDMLFLPFAYAAMTYDAQSRKRWLGRAVGAFAVVGVIFLWQMAMFPREANAVEQGRALKQLATALQDLKKMGFTYPPLLMFGLPMTLLVMGWRNLQRYHRVALLYTIPLLTLYALTSEFRESRTHAPMFLMLLPGAVLVASRWIEGQPTDHNEAAP